MQQLLTQHQSLYYAWQLTRRTAREIDLVADRLVSVAQAVQWNKQARRVFENKTDCQTVKARLMAALAQQDQGGHQ